MLFLLAVTLGGNVFSAVHEEGGRFARKLFAGDEVAAPSRANNLRFLRHHSGECSKYTIFWIKLHAVAVALCF